MPIFGEYSPPSDNRQSTADLAAKPRRRNQSANVTEAQTSSSGWSKLRSRCTRWSLDYVSDQLSVSVALRPSDCLCAVLEAPLEESSSARVLTMDDHSDDIRRPLARVFEVCASVGRKRWPDELKVQIVAAESLQPGAVVTDIARRHGCRPQKMDDWRHRARSGRLAPPASAADTLSFVPLVSESSLPAAAEPSIAGSSCCYG